MIKWYLLSSSLIVGFCLFVFQNCAGGAVPSNVRFGTASSASVAYIPAACALDNQLIPSGTLELNAYVINEVSAGAVCPASVSLLCNSGVWTDPDSDNGPVHQMAYGTCTSVAGCTFNNTSIISGGTVNAYSATTVPFGNSCSTVEATLTCKNGTLAKADGTPASTYIYSSCSTNLTRVNAEREAIAEYGYNGYVRTAAFQDPSTIGMPYCGTETPSTCSSIGQSCFVYSGAKYPTGLNLYRTYRCDSY